jgi:hypothetical protein
VFGHPESKLLAGAKYLYRKVEKRRASSRRQYALEVGIDTAWWRIAAARPGKSGAKE